MRTRGRLIISVAAVLAAIIGGDLTGNRRAEAQGLPFGQRLGGPPIWQLGYRPFAYFNNGQFIGYGFVGPYGPISPSESYAPNYAISTYLGDSNGAQAVAQIISLGLAYAFEQTGAYAIARTNDAFDVSYEKDGKLFVQWQGQSAAARRVTFNLLDTNRTSLKEIIVEKLPVEARFESNPKAAFIQTIVTYVNGTTNTVTCAVKPANSDSKDAVKPLEKPTGATQTDSQKNEDKK